MAKQFEEAKPYLVAGGLLNRYEEASDKVLGDNDISDNSTPDPKPWYPNVFNDETTDFAAGQIVGRKEPTISASDIEATADEPKEWFDLPIDYLVEAYDPDTHGDNFLVLLQDLPQGETAKAASSGEVKVIIDITDTTHKYAQIPDGGDGTYLASGNSGILRITDQPKDETSGEPLTGQQLCTTFFPVSQGGGGAKVVRVLCNRGGKLSSADGVWNRFDSVYIASAGADGRYGYINANVTESTTEVTVVYYAPEEDEPDSETIALGSLAVDDNLSTYQAWFAECIINPANPIAYNAEITGTPRIGVVL